MNDNKIRLTWRKAVTMIIAVLLFSLIMKGIAAISKEQDFIYYFTQVVTIMFMLISVLKILTEEDK